MSTNVPGATSGHEVWERIGKRRFALTFVMLSQDPTTPFQSVKIRATLNLDADGDTVCRSLQGRLPRSCWDCPFLNGGVC